MLNCIDGLLNDASELNNFNLADDMIEAYRPVVDLYVAQNFTAEDEVLTPTQKSGLFNITNYLVRHNKKQYRVMLSIDRACTTLAGSITEQSLLLELPDLLPLELHRYE